VYLFLVSYINPYYQDNYLFEMPVCFLRYQYGFFIVTLQFAGYIIE